MIDIMKTERRAVRSTRAGIASSWSKPKGSVSGYRFALLFCRVLGYGVGALLVGLTTLFYAVFAREARRSSREYLARVYANGSPASRGFLSVWRHFRRFGMVILDRLRLYEQGREGFTVHHSPVDEMLELKRSGTGCVIAGVHFGAFELSSVLLQRYRLPTAIVMFDREKKRVGSYVDRLRSRSGVRILYANEGAHDTVFSIYRLLKEGYFVAMSADRFASTSLAWRTNFLGAPAWFNLGPFITAAIAQAPVFTSFMVRRQDGYHVLRFPLLFPRASDKDSAFREARKCLQQYVGFLEEAVRRYPLEWFNFYPFWADRPRADR